MSILAFKSALLGGGARANQFRVTLNFPASIDSTTAANKAQFLVESASLPGQNIGIATVFYRGREVKLAGERRFNNWRVQIINDNDFDIHTAFEKWMQMINNKAENTGTINPTQYTVDMNVEQLDRNGGSLKKYTFKDAWPVSISDINLGFDQNDAVEKFAVEFAIGWFEEETGPAATVSLSLPF